MKSLSFRNEASKSMRSLTICLLILLTSHSLRAQPRLYSLPGSVKDATTGKPIPGASVFLEGSSKGALTRDDGSFLIGNIPGGGYQLIISAIGYTTYQTNISTSQLPSNLNVALDAQASVLASVTVEPAEKDGWKNWGGLFWDNFIGTDRNASFCTIENRDALRFRYHPKTKTVTVSATQPLVIVNQALGYRIYYRLQAFSYDLALDTFSFYGYPFFSQLTSDDEMQRQGWQERRRLAYLGSRMHFMRSLYSGRLREEGFTVSYEIREPNVEKARVQAIYDPQVNTGIPHDSLRHYKKVLREPDTLVHTMRTPDSLVTVNADQTRSFYFTGDFEVSYFNKNSFGQSPRSVLELSYPVPLKIEENGSFLPTRNLFTTGDWVKTGKIADLLPWDYYPPVSGSSPAETPDNLVDRFFAQYPNEQVHLQLDNHYYLPGDTVWYKAYVTDNGVPSLTTRTVYLDWFDGRGHRIGHQAVPLASGMGAAQYILPTGIAGKRAHVIGYTRWMLNDSSKFAFHQDIALLGQSSGQPQPASGRAINSDFMIRFFPEGGELVKGVVNKVAVRAIRKDGSPAGIKGTVKDYSGNAVADFSTDAQGLGYFYLRPTGSGTLEYTAQWSDASDSGTTFHSPLPPVRSTGISMEVQEGAGERKVTLRRPAGRGGSYNLMATADGSVVYLATINLSHADSGIFSIPVEGYPDGTLTFTVLDNKWTPIAERTVYIRRGDTAAIQSLIDLSVQKKGLSADGETQILLRYNGASAANISVAATDAALPDSRSNTSQLFAGSSAAARRELDLLALTGEWKHYDWKAILGRHEESYKYPRDTSYFSLAGKALHSPEKEDRLLFLVKERGYLTVDTVALMANGELADSAILFDTTWVLFRPSPKQKKYTFQFDHLSPAAWDQYPFPDEAPPPKTSSAADTADLSKRFGKMLQAATVTAPRRISRMDSLENVYESEQLRHSQGYLWDAESRPASDFNSFVHVLQDQVPDFPSRRFTLQGQPLPPSKYIWLIDEGQVPYESLQSGNFPPVVLVKYFPSGQASFGGVPVVAMYTKKYDFTAKNRTADPNEYIITGYTPTQAYDTLTWQPGVSRAHTTDLRRTLYWNPSVYLDPNNNSVLLHFTNNDFGGPIRIIVDGMDETGKRIHQVKVISN